MAALRRHALPLAVLALVGLAGALLGGAFAVLVALLALPVLAWRYDDRTGSLLVLAILFDIAVLVMVLLIALMAVRA